MAGNTISIDASAITRWASSISAGVSDQVQKQINLALKNSANLVQRQEAKEMPRGVTGKMAGTIRQIVTTLSATIGPNPELDYPLYVHEGTKPHMPPVEAITQWAESKGINPWALAMSIKKKGTKANPFVDRTYDDVEDAIGFEFQTACQSIIDFMARA